jgi:hypothetical protein
MRGVIRWAHGLLGFKLLAPIVFMIRGKTTTLCRPRDEPGEAKAPYCAASMTALVLA